MVSSVNALNSYNLYNSLQSNSARVTSKPSSDTAAQDKVEFGKSGALSTGKSMQVVLDRAMEKLRSVVSQARSELGLSDDQTLDTSPDATAQRIADFALGFFGKYAEQHGLADDEDGRKAFADFIGGAIQQGIDEARGILTALNSLSGEVDKNINSTWENIQNRLSDFVKNGLSNPDQAI